MVVGQKLKSVNETDWHADAGMNQFFKICLTNG